MTRIVNSLSVITVCLNARSTIEATIKSVQKQSYENIEHIIIDGESTDGTLDVIKAKNPEYFISESDDGIYYAMQKGVDAANGDIVFFLNSGDIFYDNSVIADVMTFFNKSGSDAVFGNLLPYYFHSGDKHDHKAFRNKKLLDLSYFNNRKLFFDESIHHQTLFYKKNIFNHCGFICDDPMANGEYFLNMCAFVKHGYKIKHFPRTICKFALGGKSTSNFTEEWKHFTKAREYLRKRFFPFGQDISITDENEYLYYPPSFKSRLKIILRRFRWYPVLLQAKDKIQLLLQERLAE